MRGWARGLCIAVLLACGACAEVPPAPPPPPPPDPKTEMRALETRILELVSVERQKIDPAAKPLSLDPELAGVAREKSADMAKNDYFAHKAPNGDTTATLIMNEDAKFQGLLGENIAAEHYRPETGVDVDKFANEFVETWIDSPPHKENLAFAAYDRTGVGAAVNGDTVYVTQLFATDMGLKPPPDDPPQAAGTPQAARRDDSKKGAPPAPVPRPAP